SDQMFNSTNHLLTAFCLLLTASCFLPTGNHLARRLDRLFVNAVRAEYLKLAGEQRAFAEVLVAQDALWPLFLVQGDAGFDARAVGAAAHAEGACGVAIARVGDRHQRQMARLY